MLSIWRASLNLFLLCLLTAAQARERQDFNFGWKFVHGDPGNAQAVGFDDAGWKEVDLPHDWSIERGFHAGAAGGWRGGYAVLGTGWYRKTFEVPAARQGRKIHVEFDGIYKNSTVWINGVELGRRWYGYVPFRYDLTPHIEWGGRNVIAVKVDTPQQTCRWYNGAGIYRNVWLTCTDKLAVDLWGVHVTTAGVAADSARVRVRTEVVNAHAAAKPCVLVTELLDDDGRKVGEATAEAEIPGGGTHRFEQEIEVAGPSLWSAATPVLYSAKTVVRAGPEAVDEVNTPFGIRTIEWNADAGGLVVNGRPEFLNGVNIHHDLGSLGAAFNKRAMERRLEVLKAMGCNAIRMAHNPPAREVLGLCDRMGFYVIDEAFDKWGDSRHATFEQDWRKDLAAMIRRDRNHPCVVLWSVGNENWHYKWPQSGRTYDMMVEEARKHDDTRKFTFACSPGNFVREAAQMDVASLNYHEALLDPYLKELPDKVILISESYSYWSGSDGNAQAFRAVNPTLVVKHCPQVAGTFLWTGIEYLGEAKSEWPLRGWNGAPVDTCAIPKPVAYLHRSLWSEEPMVHLAVFHPEIEMPKFAAKHWGWPNMASHWTFPKLEGRKVEIRAFSNCDEVELVVNGKSLGRKKPADFEDRMVSWPDVPYHPGGVRAVGFRDGSKVCAHELKTAGAAKRLVMVPDRGTIEADRYDLSHLLVTIVDENGVVVPDASHEVTFEVSGAGRLRAIDNGNLLCTEPYHGTSRPSYEGRNMAVVQAGAKPGTITVTAAAEGLDPASVTLTCR